MADLITLAEYKAFAGVDPTNLVDDPRITALLPAASRAVRKFTDRKFEIVNPAPSTRTFLYAGDGFVEIDDCSNITLVTTNAGVLGATYDLAAEQWTALPSDPDEPYYYLILHSGPFALFSPEMGFERNLDRYEPSTEKPVTVSVTANWGWSEVPEDVQLATVWTIQDVVEKPSGDNLASEAIEGFARSWAGSQHALALPNRARDLLVNYQRVF
jgi:hypothetical protein